jgi:hypothetical protein
MTHIGNKKSFKLIFADIYDLVVDEKDQVFPEESSDVLRIKEEYDVSSEEIVVLASLMHSYPASVYDMALRASLKGMTHCPQDILSNLASRNFIKASIGTGFYNKSYSLTPEAYESICEDKPFGYSLIENCLEELKSCDLATIVSRRWLEYFNKSMDLPANGQFQTAVMQMGISRLPVDVQIAFWVMARHFIHNFLSPLACRNDDDAFADVTFSQNLMKDSLCVLVKEGLVNTLPIEPQEDTKDTDRFVLAPRAAGLLFRGHEELIRYDEISKYGNVIKAKDIVKKDLFFSPQTQEEVNHLRKMVSREGFERACAILRRQKRNTAIQSLFWGPPGTGKTEVVKQIARETCRDVIMFDVSKVTASAWGASEKYYRAIFRAYNYMAEISELVPILLMNEADTVLSKRLVSIERAIDKSENAISNILLQEFEDMSGILLATTNLIDNLDDAFDRRFLFKTQMCKPDSSARFHIWKTNIPSLSDDDARVLSERYEMSGAQIGNVATKWNLAELYYEGERGPAYLERLCQKELATEKGTNAPRTKIGF